MIEQELREALMSAWMGTDKAYIATAKAGIAAHEAGNREAQYALEAITQEIGVARKHMMTAMLKLEQL